MPKNAVSPETIPEVMTYLEAKQMLDTFTDRHREIFDMYSEIAEELNRKRQAADKIVRDRKVSCGPWDLFQEQTTFNAEALYEALGRDGFLAVGGKLQTKTVYSLDKNKVKAAITRGDVPENVAEAVVKITPKYKAPKDIEV
jgi:hypothetical protein